jgi:hypothetical protein
MAKKTYTEEDRRNFAYCVLRGKPDHLLRRVASAYDWASTERDAMGTIPQRSWESALKRFGIENFTINGRAISYGQARIAYRLVHGEFGGLKGPSGDVAIFENPFEFYDVELGDRPKPTPIPVNTPITFRQSVEDCLTEQDKFAVEN